MIGTDDLRDHQARCVPHMAILQMFASSLADAQLPPDAARRVAEATSAILAEARAAGRAALTAVADDGLRSANLSLLTARQARLEHAAEDAIASAREAAQGSNVAALRQRLQRFDTLTSAMWTVQLSVWEHAAASSEVARFGLSAADVLPDLCLPDLRGDTAAHLATASGSWPGVVVCVTPSGLELVSPVRYRNFALPRSRRREYARSYAKN
jgi:hypothetical protein